MTNLNKLKNISLDYDILKLNGNNHIRRKYIRSLITKDLVYEFLETNKWTIHYSASILEKIGLVGMYFIIMKIARENNIHIPNILEANSKSFTKKLRQNTVFHKYKCKHVLSKESPFYEKRNNTVKIRYGVDNVFQLDSVIDKIKQTCLNKYGESNFVRTQYYKLFCKNHGRLSISHNMINNILIKNNINFISEDFRNKFKKFNKYLNKIYSPQPDIVIDDIKLVIEIYGDSWHANPKKYKKNDLIYKFGGLTRVEDIWNFDKNRKKQIESFGYKVIELWCSDIEKNINKIENKIIKIYENRKNKIDNAS